MADKLVKYYSASNIDDDCRNFMRYTDYNLLYPVTSNRRVYQQPIRLLSIGNDNIIYNCRSSTTCNHDCWVRFTVSTSGEINYCTSNAKYHDRLVIVADLLKTVTTITKYDIQK